MFGRQVWRWSGPCVGIALLVAGCAAQGYSARSDAGIDYLMTPSPSVAATATPGDSVDNEPVSQVPLITMGVSVFTGNHNLQIKAGTAIQLANTDQGGGLHLIYTGKIGTYQAEPGAPAALNSPAGIVMQRGETASYVFPTPGTYYLTCQYHPSMIVKITVTP